MYNDIIELNKKFIEIRNQGLIESLRNGSTGFGYTFESLIEKKEDQESKPDFKSVEIKCSLYHTKKPITLFCLAPERDGSIATRYIFEKYSFYKLDDYIQRRCFYYMVYNNTKYEIYNTKFNLKVDYLNRKVIMQAFKNDKLIEDICYWTFQNIEQVMLEKMKYLALITGESYNYNNKKYYKYFNIQFYSIYTLFEFLKLIENNLIYINFYMKEDLNKLGDISIKDHGVAFRIYKNNIDKLFHKIDLSHIK